MEVSVCVLTYNHGKYIRDALEGILMQEVNFEYEILVCDDASIDNTQMILREYKEKYPDKVNLFLEKENQYSKGNKRAFYQNVVILARGKYIAYCEGDDYWTDKTKLQRQFDFMEKNSEYVFCCHAAKVVNVYKEYLGRHLGIVGDHHEIVLEKNVLDFYATASRFIRKSCMNVPPDYYYIGDAWDFPEMVYLLIRGKGFFDGREMSAYRTGVENSSTQRFKVWTNEIKESYYDDRINILKGANLESEGKYDKYIQQYISLVESEKIKLEKSTLKQLILYIEWNKINKNKISRVWKIKIFIIIFIPNVALFISRKRRLILEYLKKRKI